MPVHQLSNLRADLLLGYWPACKVVSSTECTKSQSPWFASGWQPCRLYTASWLANPNHHTCTATTATRPHGHSHPATRPAGQPATRPPRPPGHPGHPATPGPRPPGQRPRTKKSILGHLWDSPSATAGRVPHLLPAEQPRGG